MTEEHYTPFQILELHREHWPETDTPAHRFAACLGALREIGYARARRTLGRYDLTVAEFDVLAALRRSPPPHEETPTEIQRRTVITSGGLTKILKNLERAGLTRSGVREEDRRSKRIRLTERGKETAERAMEELLREDFGWAVRDLSPDELEQAIALLGKVIRSMLPGDSR